MRNKGTICMLMTPKIIRDFDNPDEDVAGFLDYHRELFAGAEEVIVVIGVSQFCVMVDSRTARRNIRSKIKLEHPKILACVDYVDCWYGYKSYAAYSKLSKRCLKLEEYLVRYAEKVDGIWFMGHDEVGRYIPSYLLSRLNRKWEGARTKLGSKGVRMR